jgi:pimeloyl-ACP methyl ester carboxylesterase
MHGNSSARIEVIPQLSYLLSLGVAVFAFDFAGSGKSDGDYVSLGHYEREDLSCIVAHLRATNVVSTIALWGRSMGAATSLMYGDRDPSIACMILDSPFTDLTQLCEELVEKGREQGIVVPSFVVHLAIRMLQNSVKKQAGFNIKSISPIAHADKCFIPSLFVAGEHDDFIKKVRRYVIMRRPRGEALAYIGFSWFLLPQHHSEQIYERYAGDKNLIIVEGDHNSPRPKFMFDSAAIFLQTCLQIPNSWALNVPVSMNLMCPPWYFEIHEQRSARRRQQQFLQQQQQQYDMLAANAVAESKRSSVSNESGRQTSDSSSVETVLPQRIAPPSEVTTNGFDHDEVGMTSERQRAIQASLFKMLGQADGPIPSNTNGTRTREGGASTKLAG